MSETIKPTEEQRQAVEAVLKELDAYQGEIIEAHEHLLHKAVVVLERVSRPRRLFGKKTTVQPYVLFRPAKMMWFRLLWKSRGADRERLTFLSDGTFGPDEYVDITVKEMAALLSTELREWLKDGPDEYVDSSSEEMAAMLSAELRKWLTAIPVQGSP